MSSNSPLAALFEPTLPGFWVVLIGAAAFVWISGSTLPPLVASHFGLGGQADGFMARGDYLSFMLIGVIVIPLLIVMPQRIVRRCRRGLINVPNRDVLAGAGAARNRRSTTCAITRCGSRCCSSRCCVSCTGKWCRPTRARPARLVAQPFVIGMVVYVVAVLFWIAAMIRHFHRRPAD